MAQSHMRTEPVDEEDSSGSRDELRARHRLQNFLLRRKGRRPAEKHKAWSTKYMQWVKGLKMALAAEEAVRQDYVSEADHAAGRIERLERAIG